MAEMWGNEGNASFNISVGGFESSDEDEDSNNSNEECESLSDSELARPLNDWWMGKLVRSRIKCLSNN